MKPKLPEQFNNTDQGPSDSKCTEPGSIPFASSSNICSLLSINNVDDSFNVDSNIITETTTDQTYCSSIDVCKNDSFLKMKVKVAAAELSHSMAAATETFVSSGDLPAEAIYTAEFVEIIDEWLDSLNGFGFDSSKEFYRALSENSPHLTFWSNIDGGVFYQSALSKALSNNTLHFTNGSALPGQEGFTQYILVADDAFPLSEYLMRPYPERGLTHEYRITLRSIIDIWNRLKQDGFKYLFSRSLNQEPLGNLFGLVRQHEERNTNPTCLQFVAALKTSVINNLSNIATNGSCENDNCSPQSNLTNFLEGCCDNSKNLDVVIDYKEFVPESTSNIEDNQATAYVAGYLLHKIAIPDCDASKKTFVRDEVTNKNIFVNFKELRNATTNLIYASEKAITTRFLQRIPIEVGLHKHILSFMSQISFEAMPLRKYCVLMSIHIWMCVKRNSVDIHGLEEFPEGKTKHICDKALVFMLRGINQRWKQPIAVYLVKSATKTLKLAKLIEEVVDAVHSLTAFKILATISDQGSSNISAVKYLSNKSNFSPEDCIYTINVADIYHIFDTPRLLKYKMLYEKDGMTPDDKVCPKLSEYHINPMGVQKMKVAFAAQVFSNTVYAALSLLQSFGCMDSSSGTTAFVHFMDQLFDSLNSRCRAYKPLTKPLSESSEKSYLNFWAEAKRRFLGLKFVKDGKPVAQPLL
ncbi:hypothetical protein ILUMI_05816, partial [Ignelater luminosus]